jgi:hypothetical protein
MPFGTLEYDPHNTTSVCVMMCCWFLNECDLEEKRVAQQLWGELLSEQPPVLSRPL